MKVLYAREFSGEPLEWIIEQLHPQDAGDNYLKFACDLVRKTEQLKDQLDQVIREHTEKWEIERIASLDRILLRMAICEIRFFPDIPPRVTINEAIEMAKKYSTDKSDKFINGILDAVFHREKSGEDPEVKADVHKD